MVRYEHNQCLEIELQQIPQCLACLGGGDPWPRFFLATKLLQLTACMASYRSVLEEPSCSGGKIGSNTAMYEAIQFVRRKKIVA
jgi:hypothetical protein